MTKEEAERAVRAEWPQWAASQGMKSKPTGRDGLLFFTHLQKKRPEVLRFKASGDKWEVVHGWLLRAGLVSD